jgi:N,N'-diacetyllegionaminate synthase
VKIKIGKHTISQKHPPFIIAEAGINHNGKIDIAFSMIAAAKEAGADAIKFQTYKTEEFIGDKNLKYSYTSRGKQITESMFEMFKRYEFSKDEWVKIKKKCDKAGIIFMSTPQNYSDLELLLEIGIPAIKIGSDDFTNIPLIKEYSKTGLPIILSCGMADMAEVYHALEAVGAFNGYPSALLLCTSEYPTPPEHVNLSKLKTLRGAFNDLILGFSDHTQGALASSLAVAMGAVIFEKHFTLDNDLPGPDHWFSENPESLNEWVSNLRISYSMMGSSIIMPTDIEITMRSMARRSITVINNIAKGERFDYTTIGMKRPGNGLPPSMLSYIIGRKATRDIKIGTTLTVGDFI